MGVIQVEDHRLLVELACVGEISYNSFTTAFSSAYSHFSQRSETYWYYRNMKTLLRISFIGLII